MASLKGLGKLKPKWVIVQLSSTGEREKKISVLIRSVQQILKRKVEVFVPAISQNARGDSQTMFYIDGYIFVKYEEDIPYLKLQDTTYFSSVLCIFRRGSKKAPQYSLLEDNQLDSMRKGMNSLKQVVFKVGEKVKVVEGNYKNLIGRVSIILDKQNVQISIDLQSKKLLMDFPTTYLTHAN